MEFGRAGLNERTCVELMRTGLFAITALGMLIAPMLADAQPAKPRRVGVLLASTSAPGVVVDPWLVELGYREGENIAFERRFAAGRDDRLPELAADLTRLKVDVILAVGLPAIRAAKQATRTIPIVMIAEGDPVKAGLVASVARPGGNLTGVTVLVPELSAKRLELLNPRAETPSDRVQGPGRGPAIPRPGHEGAEEAGGRGAPRGVGEEPDGEEGASVVYDLPGAPPRLGPHLGGRLPQPGGGLISPV